MAQDKQLTALMQRFRALDGVRGALLAATDGSLSGAGSSGLSDKVANDVARTARRMAVASATVGSPVEELSISFGPARLVIVPLPGEAILVVLVDREEAMPTVRGLISRQRSELERVIDAGSSGTEMAQPASRQPEDEIERLLAGELGPILNYIATRFCSYMERSGIMNRDKANGVMRTQTREWLLCCSPSPYTFPLLLDALAQQLNDAPDVRVEFVNEVQEALQYSDIWSGKVAP